MQTDKKTNLKAKINEIFMDKIRKIGVLKTSKLAEDNVKALDSGVIGLAEEAFSKEAEKMIKEKKIEEKVSSMAREKILEFAKEEISREVEKYSKEKTKDEISKWTNTKIKELKEKTR